MFSVMTEILENMSRFLHDDAADDDRAMTTPPRFLQKNSTLKILKIGIPEIITVNVPKMEKLMHVTSKRSRQNGKQCTA